MKALYVIETTRCEGRRAIIYTFFKTHMQRVADKRQTEGLQNPPRPITITKTDHVTSAELHVSTT